MGKRQLISYIAGLALLAGCTGSSVEMLTEAPTDLPTEAIIITLTTEPTEAAVATPTIAPTIEVLPTESPAYEGPIVQIVYHYRGLYVTNSDGTENLTVTTEQVYGYAVRPVRDENGEAQIAYVTKQEAYDAIPVLKIVSVPSLKVQEVTPLIGPDLVPQGLDRTPEESETFYSTVASVLYKSNEMEWSRDGQWLAFLAKLNERATNIYSFEYATQKVRWLTSGPSNIYEMMWSPDSHWIVHTTLDHNATCGECPSIDKVNGLWAVSPDGGSFIPLDTAKPTYLVGWLDTSTFLSMVGPVGTPLRLRAIDVQTGQIKSLPPICISNAVAGPMGGPYLIDIASTYPDNPECAETWEEGVYFVSRTGSQQRAEVVSGFKSGEWSDDLQMFILYYYDDTVGLNTEGRVFSAIEGSNRPDVWIYEGGLVRIWVGDDGTSLRASHGPDFDPRVIGRVKQEFVGQQPFEILP